MHQHTSKQIEVLTLVNEMLSEHFDGYILGTVINADAENPELHAFGWYGGGALALGLTELLANDIHDEIYCTKEDEEAGRD